MEKKAILFAVVIKFNYLKTKLDFGRKQNVFHLYSIHDVKANIKILNIKHLFNPLSNTLMLCFLNPELRLQLGCRL